MLIFTAHTELHLRDERPLYRSSLEKFSLLMFSSDECDRLIVVESKR